MLALSRFKEAILAASLLGLASAIPTFTTNPTLHVFNLGAFLSNDPKIPSYFSFHVRDARPEYYLDEDCTFLTSVSSPSIWTEGWVSCDEEQQVEFWMERGSLTLRRADRGSGHGRGNVTISVTDKQPTYWAEANEVACANVTRTILGTTFSRTVEWLFPLTHVLSA